ncbi:MAG: tRNA (adenosine(37)-N6)-threonylcarbamoyltransferase complex dimerization subunit type 1 TsaB [Candidatus Erginobacter occultus]|nr:tRNA (adenosine(37)-N6)-threonylcarbamoyltransferase complex dimerization subunit type 1 TsaB [Candidatus Erginobacter occultus]
MARILGIETSTAAGSLALVEDGRRAGEAEIDTRLNHSACLLPVLDELLRRAGWEVSDLDGVGVGVGPGSFTGIRVGLAAGQGLALGAAIPLVGVGSFPALARSSAVGEGIVVALLDGGRGRIYGARYRKSGSSTEELVPPRVIAAEELAELVRGGRIITPDGLRLRARLEAIGIGEWEDAHPRALEIALLTGEKLKTDPTDQLYTAEPIYLSELNYSVK